MAGLAVGETSSYPTLVKFCDFEIKACSKPSFISLRNIWNSQWQSHAAMLDCKNREAAREKRMYENMVPPHQRGMNEDYGAGRRDFRTAQIVEAGIALQDRVSTLCAFEYLRSEGIAETISQRVLTQPALRRASIHNR
jgi:hypothetical protein